MSRAASAWSVVGSSGSSSGTPPCSHETRVTITVESTETGERYRLAVAHQATPPRRGIPNQMTKPLVTLAAAVLIVSACSEVTQPEDASRIEVWTGIATPVATEIHGAAADAAVDTLWIQVRHQREVLSDIVYATLAIWESDPDPCDIWWLADKGSPCYYMTKGDGIGVPFVSPGSRVLDFTLPILGNCELAGPIDDSVWDAQLRCGDFGRLYYTVAFSEATAT